MTIFGLPLMKGKDRETLSGIPFVLMVLCFSFGSRCIYNYLT
jgi:hypothetical protein